MSINQITWAEAKETLNLSQEEHSFTELLIFSCSAEIETHLDRSIRERTITEYLNGCQQNELLLKDYPVREIYTLHCDNARNFTESSLIPVSYYTCFSPETETEDRLNSLLLTDGWRFPQGKGNIRITYRAGYPQETIPQPIKTACIELLAWQIKRYQNKQIGVKGLVNEKRNRERPILDSTMPDHVITLLEPYRRKRW